MSARTSLVAAVMGAVMAASGGSAATFAQVRADFDGDGKADRAAIETTASGWRLVATVGTHEAVLENQPGSPDGFFLKPVAAGRYGGVRVRHAAFEFGREESGSQIIWWTGKRWARIQQGD